MKNNVIFFSIDRLGDYLIRSNVIKKISDNFKQTEIICSDKNFKLIQNQKFFNKVYIFNSHNKIKEKFKFIYNFFFKKYDHVIVFDGKSISYLLLFFIKARFKLAFIYKKTKILNNIIFFLTKILFNLFGIKYIVLNSRAVIENGEIDNYPKKYLTLKKYYDNIDNTTYYFQNNTKSFFSKIMNSYIVIHLDEKFNDIIDINNEFNLALENFSNKIDKKIILTSYNNNFNYYHNLLFPKKNLSTLTITDIEKYKITIIENLSLSDFNSLLKNSNCNISCHSGYFVHTSLGLKKKTIDIINETDQIWLQTWISEKNKYKIILKSKKDSKLSIKDILELIKNEI